MATSPTKNPFALYFMSLGAALLGGVAFFVDLPIASWFAGDHGLPGDIEKFVNLSEIFAHGFGIAIIALTIAVLDPKSLRKIPRLLACAWLPGVVVNLVKSIVIRQRPYTFIADQVDANGSPIFSPPESVFDTFTGYYQLSAENGLNEFVTTVSRSEIRSFPSGHTAAAFGLAIALGWLYPRGRWLFFAFAGLAALQRLSSLSHFPSDVCFGAAISFLIAAMCIDQRLLGRFFTRLEALQTQAEAADLAVPEATDQSEES